MSQQQQLLNQELTVSQILRTYGKGKLLGILIALRYAGIDRNLLIEMNDSGFTFDEIADFFDKFGSSKSC